MRLLFVVLSSLSAGMQAEPGENRLAPVIVEEALPVGPRAGLGPGEFSGSAVLLDTNRETSLTRLLARQPGVYAHQAGGDHGPVSFQLRGQDPNQTRYFLEGLPLTDAQYHSAQIGWFPAEAIASIDLFPEATPALLGGDGLGGAVALHLAPPGSRKSFLGARAGSFGARRVFGQGTSGGFSAFLEAFQSTEDFWYRSDGGTPLFPGDDTWERRQHNGQRWLSLLPQWRIWQGPGVQADAFSFHTLRQTQIPGAVGMPLQGDLTQQFHLLSGQVSVQRSGARAVLAVFSSYLDQSLRGPPSAMALQVRDTEAMTGGLRSVVEWDTAGVDFQWMVGPRADQVSLTTGTGVRSSARRFCLPTGLSTQSRWGPVALKPALMLEAVLYRGDTARDTLLFSPRIGAEWNPALARWRANVGYYQRAPSLSELYGAPSTVSANPSLRKEGAFKAEIGLDRRWRTVGLLREIDVSLTLSASFNHDLIVFVPNSQWSFIAENIGSSRILSPEVGLSTQFGRWTGRLNGALLATQNTSEIAAYRGRKLPMRPDYRGGADLQWASGPWIAAYTLNTTGPFFADAANGRWVGPYWEHSLSASWHEPQWGSWLLELRNLTNAMTVGGQEWNTALVQNATGVAGFPAPGRRVYLTWRYEI